MLTIYGYLPEIQKCINCDSSKRLCTAKGKEFEFKSIADEKNSEGPIFNDHFTKMLEKLGRETAVGLSLPIIFEDEKYIGSFNELRSYFMKK